MAPWVSIFLKLGISNNQLTLEDILYNYMLMSRLLEYLIISNLKYWINITIWKKGAKLKSLYKRNKPITMQYIYKNNIEK